MGLSFHLAITQRKVKKRRRRSEAPETTHQILIPMDLVMDEILTRLPAKSLMRFKCVSTLWSSHITSRYFTNRFRTVPSRPRPQLYMCLRDLLNFKESVTVILSLVPATPSSFVVDHEITNPQMGDSIMQNHGAFMYYTLPFPPQIFNPATRQLVTLPALIIPPLEIEESQTYVSYYFGHDPVNDQYKVICSTGLGGFMGEIRSEHWVFVLKPGGGGSWKKVTPTPPDYCPHIPFPSKGFCMDGVIYYIGLIGMDNPVLVSFHIRSEEFKTIPFPFNWLTASKICLIDYDGKLTLLQHTKLTDKGMLDLWVLEGAANKEWSKKSLVLQPSQLHWVSNTKFFVRATTQNGKIFLIPQDFMSPFYVLRYDLQSNDMRKIEIKGLPDHWFSKDKRMYVVNLIFMEEGENVMHLET